MTRKLALLLIAGALAFTGCNKIKLPSFGKDKAPEPTPAPLVVEAPPAPALPPPVAEPAKPDNAPHAAVMVLCYHRFEDRPKDTLAINPVEFEKQMQGLKDAGFAVIKMQDFLAWRRGEKGIPAK